MNFCVDCKYFDKNYIVPDCCNAKVIPDRMKHLFDKVRGEAECKKVRAVDGNGDDCCMFKRNNLFNRIADALL